MTIEKEMFKGKQVGLSTLEDFGFEKSGKSYFYTENFLETFQARIRIDHQGRLTGQVWDLDLDEEYTAFRASQVRGAFVGQVRQTYLKTLEKIAQTCFTEKLAISPQGSRLVDFIAKEWEDALDRPFEKHPQYFSYRVAGKWYALLFPLKMEKFGDFPKEIAEKEVEVINLKVPAEHMEQVLSLPSVYPSYHMSKKSWVSVVLDDGLTDQVLFDLLATSRSLTAPKGYYPSSGPDYWVIPANPKVFDIDSEFAENKIVYWTQKATIQTGDLVAMYITAPVRALRYVCRVLGSQLENHRYPEESNKLLMQVELLHTFTDDEFPIDRMKELGVKAVRGPRRMTKELAEAVKITLENEKNK
ncbi:MmcQ/YjbR family DNA-binding protein [Streptococcus gallolyticus]|uniref:MmcQ/YjbR family DNA-binding protein n=1 Tax=Streptococcus hepaticus TaxID=3349163 RepID=UPI001C962641|nr:MmcQ/YjbR family DNA-binding protein [Streptococcus gallolyticus]MBY5042210.1 MmcQ/YjbR family DNA-binding protein [Streptococcus gallolyticus]